MRFLLILSLILCLAVSPMTTLAGADTSLTDEMYARAINFPEPELARLKKVLTKALGGEDVTLGVIGGSITEGSSANPKSNSYAGRLKTWWGDRFDGNVKLINAGISGTDSYLGVHRAYSQLLKYEPDLVIVEFSVNDWGNEFFKTSYDSLVQTVLAQPNQPAVILLFMTMESGNSAVNQHSAVGAKYRLPMISYKNAVLPEIKSGHFAWRDISPDNIHPNNEGHAIVCDLVTRYLEDVIAKLASIDGEITPFTPAQCKYEGARILSRGSVKIDVMEKYYYKDFHPRFAGNWMGGQKGSRLVFTVEDCRNIGILYEKLATRPGGCVDIYIDGKWTATLNSADADGWDHAYPQEVYTSAEVGTHTVEILPTEGKEGNFILLGLMVS